MRSPTPLYIILSTVLFLSAGSGCKSSEPPPATMDAGSDAGTDPVDSDRADASEPSDTSDSTDAGDGFDGCSTDCDAGREDVTPDQPMLPPDAPGACATGILGVVNHGELTDDDPVFGEPFGHYDIWCVHPTPGADVVVALDTHPLTGEPLATPGQASDLELLVFDGFGELLARGADVIAFDGTRERPLRVVVVGLDPSTLGTYQLHFSDEGPGTPSAVRPELPRTLSGATTMGLLGSTPTIPADTPDITNRTGENPTTATWDGKVIVRRCPDPAWDPNDYAEDPTPNQPGVVSGQYWCFHAFRAGEVTVDPQTGVPDFANAFGPGYMSTDRHVSHTGGFPVIPVQTPLGRTNPYRSFEDGTPCGVASREPTPPACPVPGVEADGVLVTYDVYIVHTATGSNPRFDTEYPVGAPRDATFFERMQIVVLHPESPEATVVDVIRNDDPYPMAVDTSGFGYRDPDDPDERNPYLFRNPDDGVVYIGGGAIEPSVTNDGRLVFWNGGDQLEGEPGRRLFGANMVYSWNPDPASPTGWSPPKNVAYMYYVEGAGAGASEVQITLADGNVHPFSDVFPIARQPFVDQQGVPYNPGTTYVPARDMGAGFVFPSADTNGALNYYIGSYPWVSWDGRNLMHKARHSFNMTVVGELTGYRQFAVDSAIDRADTLGAPGHHEVQAVWNLGQWPGKWAQLGAEFEGRTRTVPTGGTRDTPTWVLFEQDHYSELSFHPTDGSYVLYFPMSRMQIREADFDSAYRPGLTPDVSGSFNTGTLVDAGGRAAFSQHFSETGYDVTPLTSRHFGLSGNSIGFLADASASDVEPHLVASAVTGLGSELTVEGAVYLRTGGALSATPWSTVVRQPSSFELGVGAERLPHVAITDVNGSVYRVRGPAPVPTDTWVHLAARWDGYSLLLFVDGQVVAGIENVGTGADVAPATGSDLFVGPKNHDANPGGDGLVYVDEVGITLGLRTEAELAHNAYRRPKSVAPISLAAWESMWGAGALPLGFADADGTPLAPIRLGYSSPDASRAALGESLFTDSALSDPSVDIACETCHSLTAQDFGARRDEIVSTEGAGELMRNTPTVFNRVFGARQFWDGRATGLGAQSTVPIASPVEMAMPLDRLTQDALPNAGYEPAFADAFGDPYVTIPRLQQALAVYESGLVAADSAIDRHRLRGDPLPEDVARGLALFSTEGRCVGCHAPPLYADGHFHNNGQGISADRGRATITGRPADENAFRTMSLRDVDRTAPYMHDGSVPTLREVVENYNAGGVRPPRPAMRPLELTPEEIDDLVAFLEALHSNTAVVPLP